MSRLIAFKATVVKKELILNGMYAADRSKKINSKVFPCS